MNAVGPNIVTLPGGFVAGSNEEEAGCRQPPAIPPVSTEREASRGPIDLDVVPQDGAALARATANARTALHEAAFAAAEAAARARAMAEALDGALAALAAAEADPSPRPSPAGRSPQTDPLSPREWQVLALVAAGHTNKAIAEALFVSPNTAKTHVASLLRKLGAGNRVQLATIATAQGRRQHAAPRSR
jgi:DNA-binding CsgD family transcriptional regulator